MTLGDQRAFPHEYKEPGNIRVVQEGMSYRQWLVGQIVTGICANTDAYQATPDQIAEASLTHADAIIKRLEANE